MPAFYRMKLTEYRSRSFVGKPPCLNTLRKMIGNGELPGELFGGCYYVFVDSQGNAVQAEPVPAPQISTRPTGNALADKLLRQYVARQRAKGS